MGQDGQRNHKTPGPAARPRKRRTKTRTAAASLPLGWAGKVLAVPDAGGTYRATWINGWNSENDKGDLFGPFGR